MVPPRVVVDGPEVKNVEKPTAAAGYAIELTSSSRLSYDQRLRCCQALLTGPACREVEWLAFLWPGWIERSVRCHYLRLKRKITY